MSPFADLQIVELGGSVAGAYCAKMFADNGARVIRVGDDQLTEAQRRYLHCNKEWVPAASPALVAGADVVIESSASAPLPSTKSLEQSDAVRVRMTPYGPTGPSSQWLGTELTAYAHAGHLHLTGDPDREPLSPPRNHPPVATGLFGFIGAMAALIERERHGVLRSVDVSQHEVLAALHQVTLMRYLLNGFVLRRMGNRYTGQGEPNGLLRCADGWVAVTTVTGAQVEMLLLVSGLSDLLDHPKITSGMDFQTHPAILSEHLGPWLEERTVDEVTELFQSVRVPCAPARPMLELLNDDQLAARDFWRVVEGVTMPGVPFIFGEPTGQAEPLPQVTGVGAGPLAGLRVLDLSRVWAGPLAARFLAELGAEVIQVEAPYGRGPRELPESLVVAGGYHPDHNQGGCQWNRNGHMIKYGLHKKSVVIDLTRPEGVAAFEQLVPHADVLIENFSPRVMPQLGLGEERLLQLNPSLVYMTMPGYGRSGPAKDWVAYGTTVDSHAGLSHLIGYPGHSPWKNGVAWPDPTAGLHAASAMLIGLWQRAEVGGVTIEGAQFEATVASVGDSLVEAQLLGQEAPVLGNRHPSHAPQGVYPCLGDDHWVALAVLDDVGWAALCAEARLPDEWQSLDVEGRRAIHDDIDAALARWSGALDDVDLSHRLQGLGLAAAPVFDAPSVLADPQLEARGAIVDVEQPEVGTFTTTRMPLHFSGVDERPPLEHAALLGEHNAEVLCGIAGLSGAEFERLLYDGIMTTEPPE